MWGTWAAPDQCVVCVCVCQRLTLCRISCTVPRFTEICISKHGRHNMFFHPHTLCAMCRLARITQEGKLRDKNHRHFFPAKHHEHQGTLGLNGWWVCTGVVTCVCSSLAGYSVKFNVRFPKVEGNTALCCCFLPWHFSEYQLHTWKCVHTR